MNEATQRPEVKSMREAPIQELDVERATVIPIDTAKKELEEEFKSYESFLSPTELNTLKSQVEGTFRSRAEGGKEMTREDLDFVLEQAREKFQKRMDPVVAMEQAESAARKKEAEEKLRQAGIIQEKPAEQPAPTSQQPKPQEKPRWRRWLGL